MQQIIAIEIKLRSEIATPTFASSSVVTLLEKNTLFQIQVASEMECLNISKMRVSH